MHARLALADALVRLDWSAAGHSLPGAALQVLGLVGPWVLLGGLALVVALCLARSRRYRALGVLTDADRERVREAVRAAESRTLGEIVPVVVERSDSHPAAESMAALAFLLAGSAALAPHLHWLSPTLFLSAQAGFAGLGWSLARALPAFKRAFVLEARASAMAGEQAVQEFFRQGLFETAQRSGVLLFVSLLERRVIVLADEGVASKVSPDVWTEVDQAVLEGIRKGSLAEGLTAGVERAGRVLAELFPGQDERNELSDRLIVRRE